MKDSNRKFAIISVDSNDADIISNTVEVTEEQVLVLDRVANAIKSFKPYKVNTNGIEWKYEHNFPTGECLRENLGELSSYKYYVEDNKIIIPEDYIIFMGLVPYSEYGFHTVEEIRILAVIGEIKLI